MFGCVVNPPSSWARSLESESSAPGAGAALSYNEALKRTVYMADFFYPAVIPLASSLPAAPLPPGRSSATSRELKFGIDRILGSSKDLSSKDDASKSERTTSPERKVRMAASSASSASPGASSPSERRSPGPRGREGREGPGFRGHTDTAGRTPSAKHCAPSPPFPQDFLHELKFHQPIRQILPSPHDLHHPPLNHPQDLRTRAPEFLTAQDLSGRGFPMCPCPGGSPPAGILPYHPSLHHAVHLAGLHYQSHRSDYEGNYAIMTADLPPHRTHPTSSATPSTQPKRKRSWSRAVFSHLQRKGLEKRFEVQKYVTKPDRKQLAAMLGLTDAQVKVWFQNRRMKWRHAEEAKRKKDESDDITIDETSPNDVTRASPSVDASQDSDDDELCIDDVDDDSSRDNHDDVTLRGDQSGALKS